MAAVILYIDIYLWESDFIMARSPRFLVTFKSPGFPALHSVRLPSGNIKRKYPLAFVAGFAASQRRRWLKVLPRIGLS